MSPEQKRVAAWIAVGTLIIVFVALAWLTYLAAHSSFVDNPQADQPNLDLSWRIALWFIELGTGAKILFATLILVVTAGVAAAGELYRSRLQIALIAILCLASIVACILLNVLTGDETNGEALRYFS